MNENPGNISSLIKDLIVSSSQDVFLQDVSQKFLDSSCFFPACGISNCNSFVPLLFHKLLPAPILL